MTAPDKKPTRAADWVAVRRTYEAGSDPLPAIAIQHGVNIRTLQHRRKKEGWFRRRDRPARVDWLKVRRDYESGERSIDEICELHGCSKYGLHQRRQEENWVLRRPAYPRAFGAGGRVNAAVRLQVLLVRKLEALEQRLQLDEKIDPADPLTGMLTLAKALEKVVDIEAKEKRRDDEAAAGHPLINDASRMALARRLEALAESWEADEERKAGEVEGGDIGPLPPHV
jgi:hypothetical protein